MQQTLKPLCCPNCNGSYCNKDFGRLSASKFPVILPCHHSVCENCLNLAVKNQTSFTCSVCKVPVDLCSGNESLSKFSPDIHALGILNANRKQPLTGIKIKMVSSPEFIKSLHPSVLKSTVKVCDNCRQVEALWQCDECQSNFCNLCFDKVHKRMKKRKKHEAKKIFAELYSTMVQTGCKDHKNKSLEFYCEKDDQLTCSHCMLIGEHLGHEVKTLRDKNKSCAEDLKDLLGDISGIEQRLKYTEHLLTEVSTAEKIDVSPYIKAVHDQFHKLHSLLQARELQLISQLEGIANQQNEPFEKMVFEISGYQKEILSVKKDAESVIENPCLAISTPDLLKKLESFKDLPCYLLPIQANEENKVHIKLELSDELEDDLQKYGLVEHAITPRFYLVPTKDLPENYCIDIPESFGLSDIETQSTTTNSDTYSESAMSPPIQMNGMAAAFRNRDFVRSCSEAVQVSYTKDPTCFWVQRCADSRKLTSITDAINKWCRSKEAQVDRHIPIEQGDVYLVQFTKDKKWYRGRVTRILEPGETYEVEIPPNKATGATKQMRTVHNDELKVKVFYIDYGNNEVVSISKLRNIKPQFLTLPNLAKQCCLVDILPANGVTWSYEAIETFEKFIRQKPVTMQIYELRHNVHYVDLSQIADSTITNDVPVSVRDALVFLELAVFPSGSKIHLRRTSNEKQYLPPERLRLNADIAVIVSHVDSPSHLYVQQISTASYLSSMIFEMSDAYGRDNNTLLHSIFAPRVGMMCAGQFSVDKQWYRAQVIGLPGGSNVEVRYVDFGNTEVVHHKYIRKLFDKFAKLNIQAIPCKLADVTYTDNNYWSPGAKEWLTKKVSKKQLTLKSLGFDVHEKKSEVLMFFMENDHEVCVNTLIVEAGLASSSGPGSTTLRRKVQSSEIDPPPVPALSHTFENVFSYESDEEPTTPPIAAPIETPAVPTLVKKFPEKEGRHIEVHASHIVNPSLFYIRIAGEMEKKLESLMVEMQKLYADSDENEITVEDCSIGKSYAVYSNVQKLWNRGTVLSKDDDGNVKVLFVDYGMEECVPMKNVHRLMQQFTQDEEYSICCELTGIIPAGGSSQWSYAACDAFKDLIAPYEILHLNCKAAIDDKEVKYMPVSLFIEDIKLGGALEPTEVIYKNIASELVARGLALPIRNTNPKKECKSPEGCKSKETETTNKAEETDEYKTEQRKEEVKYVVQERTVEYLPPLVKWRPVEYPNESAFKGFVTNIGDDGCVQLHAVREAGSIVETIKKALQFKFAKKVTRPSKTPPHVGQACIAKFQLDNLWYRAEIIGVYPEKVKVNFVDYGNNEIVLLKDISTEIIMHNFSRQCMECRIAKIHTGKPGQWDDDLLYFLHSQLVETIVEVESLGPPDENGVLPCEIITNCGVSVSDLLESMGFMESDSELIQNDKTFRAATELQEGDIFPVCISQIIAPNVVCLQRSRISEPKLDYEKEYNKEHDSFLELIQELQEKAETLPEVSSPIPGMTCCAKYSYDDRWYRCEVTDLVEDGVVVLYVDYGNTEIIPSENLRVPNSGMVDFPVQAHFCEIYGMAAVGSDWNPTVKEFMVENLLKNDLEIFCKVEVPGNISHVDLMKKDENGEMKLIYEELVDLNLITLKKSQ